MIACSTCQFQNPDDAIYCGNCGAPLAPGAIATRCPNCGAPAPPGTRFCVSCGRQLGGPDYAGFWQRFGAFFIDAIIGGLLALIPALIVGFGVYAIVGPAERGELAPGETDPAETAGIISGYAAYFLGGALYTWLGNAYGGTFGKRIFGIRVVLEATGEDIGLARSFIRLLVYWVGYSALYLGLLWMLWDKKKQTWHDKASGSIVVKAAR